MSDQTDSNMGAGFEDSKVLESFPFVCFETYLALQRGRLSLKGCIMCLLEIQ